MATCHRVICVQSLETTHCLEKVGTSRTETSSAPKQKPQTHMIDPQMRYNTKSKVLPNNGIRGSSVSVVINYGLNYDRNKNIAVNSFYLLSEITHVGYNAVYFGKHVSPFREHMLPPSSEKKGYFLVGTQVLYLCI